jgi:hypothetical protein
VTSLLGGIGLGLAIAVFIGLIAWLWLIGSEGRA